jgi:hypothetical protein
MKFGLEGKVALVAGGSKGLGFASALALHHERSAKRTMGEYIAWSRICVTPRI